jgi:hypothetical protein
MTFAMFIVLIFWISYCGHRSPETKSELAGIDTREPGDYSRVTNYGK